jgi:FixJ family two-component response regulator
MKTAWFLDDDEEMVRVTRKMLEALDYKTKTFFNARATAKAMLVRNFLFGPTQLL